MKVFTEFQHCSFTKKFEKRKKKQKKKPKVILETQESFEQDSGKAFSKPIVTVNQLILDDCKMVENIGLNNSSFASNGCLKNVSTGDDDDDDKGLNGNGWWNQPSAPSPGLVLFNSEEQSDLMFIVTMDRNQDSLKFPGHSFIIKDSSPIFKEIIHQLDQRQRSSSDQKPIINIQCRPETLHMLMSYIYKKEVNISCVSSCLALLEVSVKFMLNELTKICFTFLCNNATEFNVLLILSSLKKIDMKSFKTLGGHASDSNHHHDGDQNGSLKSMKNQRNTVDSSTEDQESCENLVNELISRCYLLLDENADKILRSEAICDLDRETLVTILSRDSLNLTSELTAFECIQRWSVCQCQRELREIGHKTKLDVLGRDAIFSIRYLTMSLTSFMKGPFASDILSEDDKNYLQSKLLDPFTRLPPHLSQYKLDIPRKYVKASKLVRPLPKAKLNGSSSTALATSSPFDRKKKPAIKKFLNGLGDVMIFAIRIFD